jgi:hypothetical protein
MKPGFADLTRRRRKIRACSIGVIAEVDGRRDRSAHTNLYAKMVLPGVR